MASSERDTWPADSDVLYLYEGKWFKSWDAFFWARLNKLLPPQPKREWRRR